MADNKSDLLFHPVRIRIVQALFGKRRLTAQQLVEVLEGPSIATLYRHLNRLVEGGILAVVEERPVRGTLEKVYALANDRAAMISETERRQVSPEDQKRHFTTAVGALLHDFGRYIDHGPADAEAEGNILRQNALNLTDEEARQLRATLRDLIEPYRQYPPGEGRRRRMMTMILLPTIEGEEQSPE